MIGVGVRVGRQRASEEYFETQTSWSAGSGIPLKAIAPGLVKTELLNRLFEDPERKRAISLNCPMPLGGPYEPAAAAELLAFLSSEKNAHMTGQTIFIDGGADLLIRGD